MLNFLILISPLKFQRSFKLNTPKTKLMKLTISPQNPVFPVLPVSANGSTRPSTWTSRKLRKQPLSSPSSASSPAPIQNHALQSSLQTSLKSTPFSNSTTTAVTGVATTSCPKHRTVTSPPISPISFQSILKLRTNVYQPASLSCTLLPTPRST